MKERPILFSGEMVRAILDGRKTQTRRVIKGNPSNRHGRLDFEHGVLKQSSMIGGCWHVTNEFRCPYGQPADRLWVRETWKPTGLCSGWPNMKTEACARFAYRADKDQLPRDTLIKWRPSIFMPRWASRITLEIVQVRVERLQDISEDDAKAEGVELTHDPSYPPDDCYRLDFVKLWDSINEQRGFGWMKNPWVWVVEFRMVEL